MTVMTTERPTTAVAQPQAGSLAIRADQTMWTPEQAAVLRQSGISDDVTNAELAGFLHLCQRTGLDPFSRQIYLIGRKDRRAGRVVFTPQTGIDGYRVIAQRVTAQTGGTYGYEDFLWCDSAGRWRDVWLSEQPPAAAKVTVIRNGQKFSAVATFREYAQTFPDGNPSGLWGKMPAGQVAKCAEALALRKAFPHDLAGVYTAEEMQQADNPQPGVYHVIDKQAPGQDAWEQATPAPVQPRAGAEPWDAAAEGDLSGGRDWINEATEAPDADAVRALWREAKDAGVEALTLHEIGKIGGRMAAAELKAQQAAEGDAEEAPLNRDGYPVLTGPLPDAEPVADTSPGAPADARAEAEERLRIAASRANLATLDADFQRVYGKPIESANAQQLDAFRARIETAGGAQ
jgi:phage recombination protein Bet